jgi:hypothetical protein
VTGTLDVQRIGIYGDGILIDSTDLPASTINKTDFGVVPATFKKEQIFIIKNSTTKDLILNGNPRIAIVGPSASEFSVSAVSKIVAAGKSASFTVTFTPTALNCQDPNKNIREAQIRIPTNNNDYGTYYFNISGQCIPKDSQLANNATSNIVTSNFAPGTVFSADAVGRIYASSNRGSKWELLPEGIKTGEFANSAYNSSSNELYNFYITDDMLFVRKYPSNVYTQDDDQNRDADEAFDGINIIKTPEILIPNSDVFQFGIPTTILEFMSLPNFFGLPNIVIPGQILDTFEEDLRSKKTPIINEKDIKGIPVFLAGNKQGALINGYYPYSNSYNFDDKMAVSPSIPAAYISKNGRVRFFYTDSYGNINGGTLSGKNVRLDAKLRL